MTTHERANRLAELELALIQADEFLAQSWIDRAQYDAAVSAIRAELAALLSS